MQQFVGLVGLPVFDRQYTYFFLQKNTDIFDILLIISYATDKYVTDKWVYALGCVYREFSRQNNYE